VREGGSDRCWNGRIFRRQQPFGSARVAHVATRACRHRRQQPFDAPGDLGAGDYVGKPFGMGGLMARLRAALRHAFQAQGEVAVVVSNDSDLLEPIKIVCDELGKKVGIFNPQKGPSRALLPHIDFIKHIRSGALQASQFPARMSDEHGSFTKPAAW
jgi:hypothetical protein